MTHEEFETLIADEFPKAVPEKFHHLLRNVVFLAEREPSAEVRAREGLLPHETLLGLYHGIPHTARGGYYGVGGALPDTITLFQGPLEEEARHLAAEFGLGGDEAMRRAVRETIWHEVAHYMGYDEDQVRGREDARPDGTL
jgi:predicted Zn-dependent protease with MMP-like domain